MPKKKIKKIKPNKYCKTCRHWNRHGNSTMNTSKGKRPMGICGLHEYGTADNYTCKQYNPRPPV